MMHLCTLLIGPLLPLLCAEWCGVGVRMLGIGEVKLDIYPLGLEFVGIILSSKSNSQVCCVHILLEVSVARLHLFIFRC